MKSKHWVILFLSVTLLILAMVVSMVVYVDPYFIYHAPHPEFFYFINDQRFQNYGIGRFFDYKGIITGSSMCENFQASQAEELFDMDFIKVCFSGAPLSETSQLLEASLHAHPETEIVIRSLDSHVLCSPVNERRTDLGEFPDYLYDSNPFNDVNYVLSKDVIFRYVIPTYIAYASGHPGGHTSFDQYSVWYQNAEYSAENAIGNLRQFPVPVPQQHLSQEEQQNCMDNIEKNIQQLAERYPTTQFYYFVTPYCVTYWGNLYRKGELLKRYEAQKLYIESMLPYDNIKVFYFDNYFDLTTDLSRYKDSMHYDQYFNSWMLQQMKEGNYLLTEENYLENLNESLEFYMNYDYNSILPPAPAASGN